MNSLVRSSRQKLSYEEEDTCHMRRRIRACHMIVEAEAVIWGGGYMSYEKEDTCMPYDRRGRSCDEVLHWQHTRNTHISWYMYMYMYMHMHMHMFMYMYESRDTHHIARIYMYVCVCVCVCVCMCVCVCVCVCIDTHTWSSQHFYESVPALHISSSSKRTH